MISCMSATSASIRVDRRLDQHRVMDRRQQAQAAPGGPDAGNPQNVGAAALNRQIADRRALNSVMPVRQVQPSAVRITPVSSACASQSSDQRQYMREQLAVLAEHLVRLEGRDAEPRRQRLGLTCRIGSPGRPVL